MNMYTFTRHDEALALFSEGDVAVEDTLARTSIDTVATNLEDLFNAAWDRGLIEGNPTQPIIDTHHSDLSGVDWTITTRVGEHPAQARIAATFDWKALPLDVEGPDLAVAAIETVVEHLNLELRALDSYATSPAEARIKADLPGDLPGHVFHIGIPGDTPDPAWAKLERALATSPGIADVTRRGGSFEEWGEPRPTTGALEHVAVRVATSDGRPLPLDIARLIADTARKAAQAAVPGLVNWSHPNTILTDGICEYEVGGVMDERLHSEERDIHAAYSR